MNEVVKLRNEVDLFGIDFGKRNLKLFRDDHMIDSKKSPIN